MRLHKFMCFCEHDKWSATWRNIFRVASIQFNFYSQMDLLAGISMKQARYIYIYIYDSDVIYGFRTLSFPSSSGIILSLQISMSQRWLKVRFRLAMYPYNPLSTFLWRRSGLNDYLPYAAWYCCRTYIFYNAFILHYFLWELPYFLIFFFL